MTDWTRAKLKNCFKLKSGDNLTSKQMINGRFPVFGGNGIAGNHNDYNLSGDNVIIGRVGALCGNALHITDEVWLTDNAFKIVAHKYEFDNAFLTYLLNHHNLRSLARQTAQPVISNSSLSDLELYFPSSVSEQKRIVALLDSAFADIDKARANAERNLKNARELFESYLSTIFNTNSPEWNECSIQEVVDSSCSLSYGIVQPGNEFANGLPIVRPTDLTKMMITLKGLKRIDPALSQSYSRTILRKDDLLLCVRGSTGVISIASAELVGANVTRGIVPIRFQSTLINSKFAYYGFLSPQVQKQIKSQTYGAALMQINIRDLRNIRLSFPPIKDQARLVYDLDVISKKTQQLESLYARKINSLDELKKSLLHKAFTGQLSASATKAATDGQAA